MSYFAVPMQTSFPPQIARHYYSPGAIPMSGFGDDPSVTDPTQTSWWQQAVNWAQQNVPSNPSTPTDPTVPDPTQPQPSPAPAPAPAAPSAATSSSNTLLVAGSIALVGVVGLVFLLKES